MWSSKGVLRKELGPADAAERLWLFTSFEQYLPATEALGWSPDRYEQWYADLSDRELLDPNVSQ